MIRRWPLLASDPVFDAGLLQVVRDRARSPRTGSERDFHVIRMVDWLMVVSLSNRAWIYLARGVQPTSVPEPDAGEDIEVVLLDAGEIPACVSSGEINNAMTVAALALAHFAGQFQCPSLGLGYQCPPLGLG